MDTIYTYGAQVLREKAIEVQNIDGGLVETITGMFDLMYKANGVGLAANQVGITSAFAIIDTEREPDGKSRIVLINPKIVEASDTTCSDEEGCLSLPDVYGDVVRPDSILLEAFDLDGKTFRIECEGLLARAVQHEIDHLNGVMFVDRLSPLDKMLNKKKLKRLSAESHEGRRF